MAPTRAGRTAVLAPSAQLLPVGQTISITENTRVVARNFDNVTDRGKQSRVVGVDRIHWSGPVTAQFTTVRGDFDGDGSVTVRDVDLLFEELRRASPRSAFDLTDDNRVNTADRDELLRGILHTGYGDANLDRLFDSEDLLTLLQAGEYEDGIAGNSTWAEGDWNGDGEADSNDIVLAFQTGLYEIDPQAIGNHTAATVDWLFTQKLRTTRSTSGTTPGILGLEGWACVARELSPPCTFDHGSAGPRRTELPKVVKMISSGRAGSNTTR